MPGRRWHPTPVFLPGKPHGQRSLVGCSPWGREESDTTEWLHFHFSFSCIGEGNGNPLQCSCLENPRDRGAWWAAVYGVAQSRTWLKRLSCSSSIQSFIPFSWNLWIPSLLKGLWLWRYNWLWDKVQCTSALKSFSQLFIRWIHNLWEGPYLPIHSAPSKLGTVLLDLETSKSIPINILPIWGGGYKLANSYTI